jgi:hypothetical protein
MSPRADAERALRQVAGEYSEAFPESPGFVQRVMVRAQREPISPSRRSHGVLWEISLAAVVLVLGAVLAVSIAISRGNLKANPVLTPNPSPVPEADLVAAKVPAAYVTPLNLLGRRSATGTTLIGAYADPAEIVLFFAGPDIRNGLAVYDSYGWINSYTRGCQGSKAGDSCLVLAAGPHLATDGLAHLTITDTMPPGLGGPQKPVGQTLYDFSLRVQRALSLSVPKSLHLGSWTLTIEKMQATPATIFFQALINAPTDQATSTTATLVDASGKPVLVLLQGAGITVPKQQLNAGNGPTRLFSQWERPAAGGVYRLELSGNGATQSIPVTIPPL